MSPVWCKVGRIWTIFLIFFSQINYIKGDCGTPPIKPHTLPVTETSGIPGDTVVYVCDRSSGYYDIPNQEKTITCKDDGTWSSVPDFCARACGAPERLPYAVPKDDDLAKDIFLPDTKVKYNCRPGYRRVIGTDNSVTCLSNFTWSTLSEFCTRRECGHPGDVDNGEFEVSEMFLFGSRVTYKCNVGHRFISRTRYRDCQADGTWSNDAPKCEAVPCPAPVKPTDGTYYPEKDEYVYLDAVSYKCNTGLHVIGATTTSCTSDGSWSEATPTCKAVSCPDPGYMDNGFKDTGFGPYTLNSAVTYKCKDNFVINGSSSIICNVDNRWSNDIPKCLTFCAAPPNFPHVVLEEQFTNLIYVDQTTVMYKCIPGYVREPGRDNHITCSGRSWPLLAKFCSPISCGHPGEVKNATMMESEFTFGSRVVYKCQEGFHRTSAASFKECLVNGSWSFHDITCSVKCPTPMVDNAVILGTKAVYVHGDRIHVKCNTNFALVGKHEITCNHQGRWEASLPKCHATCRITESDNIILTVDSKRAYMEGEVLSIECKEGYGLSYTGTITCSSHGQWNTSPICKALDNGISIGAIIGIVIAALAVIATVILLYCCCCLSKKSGKSKSETPDVHYTACNDA